MFLRDVQYTKEVQTGKAYIYFIIFISNLDIFVSVTNNGECIIIIIHETNATEGNSATRFNHPSHKRLSRWAKK